MAKLFFKSIRNMNMFVKKMDSIYNNSICAVIEHGCIVSVYKLNHVIYLAFKNFFVIVDIQWIVPKRKP